MVQTGQSLAPTAEYPPTIQMPAPPASDFVPSPIVDDSPQTRAELVNRILGSAKISQPVLPDLPMRSMADVSIDTAALAPKGQKAPAKASARVRGGHQGIHPMLVAVVVALVLVIVGLVAFVVFKDGPLKGLDLGKAKSVEVKLTVDQLIKAGDLDKAIELLEAKKESGKFSAAEGEKLYGLYYQMADKALNSDENPAEAQRLLEKIPTKSKKFKDAKKLLRKVKKKAEKN